MPSNVLVYCPLKNVDGFCVCLLAHVQPAEKYMRSSPREHLYMLRWRIMWKPLNGPRLYSYTDLWIGHFLVDSRYTVYRNKKIPFDKDSTSINWIPHPSGWIYRFAGYIPILVENTKHVALTIVEGNSMIPWYCQRSAKNGTNKNKMNTTSNNGSLECQPSGPIHPFSFPIGHQ